MEERSFVEDAKLNKLDLANEAEKQPALTQYYSEKLVRAKHNRDRISVARDLLFAETALRIRANPPGEYKVTEAVIDALVQIDVDVVKLNNELLEAKKEVLVYEAAVDSMRNKSDMIKVETQLWVGGYFTVQ